MNDKNQNREGEASSLDGSNPKPMTCREMETFIVDYLDENLPQQERQAFVAHLDECPDCTHFLRNYNHTIKTSQQAYQDIEAHDCAAMPENLVQAILVAKNKST